MYASPLQASGQAEASTAPAAPSSGQAAASSAPAAAAAAPVSAADVARRYYEGYNSKRFDDVLELIADDCVYEGGWREGSARSRRAGMQSGEKKGRLRMLQRLCFPIPHLPH